MKVATSVLTSITREAEC